jgi:hypothetical protein
MTAKHLLCCRVPVSFLFWTFVLCWMSPVFWTTGIAQAQKTNLVDQLYDTTPLERAEAQTEVLVDVLQLDPQQAGKMVEINLKYSKRVQALINQNASDAVLYHEIQQFSEAKDNEILALLTEEQAVRYAEYKAKLRKIVADVIQRRNR